MDKMVIGSSDAHFNAILNEVWHSKLIKNYRCLRRDSNRGPLAPKSNALTTRLCKREEDAFLGWLLVPLLWWFLWKWPLRLPVTSEVTSDLISELSGLNNLCSSTFLASIVLYSTKCPEGRKKTKSTCRLALLRMLVKTHSILARPWFLWLVDLQTSFFYAMKSGHRRCNVLSRKKVNLFNATNKHSHLV